MPSIADAIQALVGAATTPPETVSSGGVQMYGFAGPDGIVLEGAEESLLPYPVATLAEYSQGDRVAITLIGQRPVIIGRVGGITGSPSIWQNEVAVDAAQEALDAQSEVLTNHAQKIADVELGVQDTKDLLAATDSVVDGLAVTVTAQGVSIEDAVQAAQSAKVAADAAVTATVVEYALSASRTVAPSEDWSTATVLPTEAKPYVWMQTKVTYGSGATVTTSPVVTTGPAGSPGTPGAPGGEGPQGVSVTAVTSYWQATTLTSAPAKPTTATPSGWGLTEPEYEAGKTLWRTEKVTYSNGQFAYSEVSKVSAYTAAGEAIHIANMSREQLEYALADTPPGTPVEGAIWFPRDEDGDITGVWRWSGAGWDTHATLTGLLLVPTEDGGQTIIGPDGVDTTQVVADVLRSKVLYVDVAGVQTLVVTDIPRQNLAEDVGDALATAEELGSRIVLSGGNLTIARNRQSDTEPLTAMTLGATSLEFVVDDKAVAYIDSKLEQMSIANILARDSLHVGAHQVRTLPGTQVTVWQFVGAVT